MNNQQIHRFENLDSKIENKSIYPVILPVPDSRKALVGREKVKFLSGFARQAVTISANKRGVVLGELLKDENGAPLPTNGCFWSISHKSEYVAGVVAPHRIGVDIEKFRPCSDGLFKKTGSDEEWGLVDSDPQTLFFRYWTSKEAVLKTAGRGIGDLSKCKIIRVMDENHLFVRYGGRVWSVEHFFFDNHIASVVSCNVTIRWVLGMNEV
jgi:4'-phosphopantetheinyl transferase